MEHPRLIQVTHLPILARHLLSCSYPFHVYASACLSTLAIVLPKGYKLDVWQPPKLTHRLEAQQAYGARYGKDGCRSHQPREGRVDVSRLVVSHGDVDVGGAAGGG